MVRPYPGEDFRFMYHCEQMYRCQNQINSRPRFMWVREKNAPHSYNLFLPECGKRIIDNEIETGTRIIGGHDAQPGAWPWQVSLQFYRSGGRFVHICAGSLINSYSVLTAAHCTRKRTNRKLWRAAFGYYHVYRSTQYTKRSKIKAIKIHFAYNQATYDNDIALFQLSKPIEYNDYIQPVCLPHSSLSLSEETECYIAGWGMKKEKGKGSFILQEAQGDSGGPLVCYVQDENKFYQIGITSHGYGCGRPRFPGIYVRLAKYTGWLRSRTTTLSIHHTLTFLPVLWVIFHCTKTTPN
ncbi:transmembrane protease serine 12-like [Sceloporus undulatus]|uniref:transmembrane protease serine 12-like n=1 Tax=Sceloporus undulatus TaxID=8520 RepID=UPI001C4C0B6A|nr:transmembrane protease serine 12-like [Sceloporus undulatus]